MANKVKVIEFPVVPGDTVYTIKRGRIKEWKVYFVGINSLGDITFTIADKNFENSRGVWDKEIGEFVFLTKQDAEWELVARQCPYGGDNENDCADCVYSSEYHSVDGECTRRVKS